MARPLSPARCHRTSRRNRLSAERSAPGPHRNRAEAGQLALRRVLAKREAHPLLQAQPVEWAFPPDPGPEQATQGACDAPQRPFRIAARDDARVRPLLDRRRATTPVSWCSRRYSSKPAADTSDKSAPPRGCVGKGPAGNYPKEGFTSVNVRCKIRRSRKNLASLP